MMVAKFYTTFGIPVIKHIIMISVFIVIQSCLINPCLADIISEDIEINGTGSWNPSL